MTGYDHILCQSLVLYTAVSKYREARERQKAFQSQGMQGDNPDKVANTYHLLVDELFDVRVLDPAMGSGHFLVEAVDFVTDRMLKFLSAFPWNPVLLEMRRTRETILEEMENQKVTIDPARLTDINLLKRHVLKRCIYGVDLNPMAVELAKLSLWLDSFTLGAPLSFLDHHLKCGNSLIGARVEEVRAAIEHGQLSLFGSNLWAGAILATDLMRHVGELEDVTAEQVRESKAQYRKATNALAPFKRILDVYTSRWFGNEVIKGKRGGADLDKALEFLRSNEAEGWLWHPDRIQHLSSEQRQVAERAHQACGVYGFFHWELEFPELFFGAARGTTQVIGHKANPGFNSVLGNPPYLNIRLLTQHVGEQVKVYLEENYTCAQGGYDIYVLFIQRAFQLLKRDGYWGMIIPNKVATLEYAYTCRSLLLDQTSITNIVDLSEFQVFGTVGVYPYVLTFKKTVPEPSHVIRVLHVASTQDLEANNPAQLLAQNSLSPSTGIAIHGSFDIEARVPTRKLNEVCRLHSGTTGFEAQRIAGLLEEADPSRVLNGLDFVVSGNIDRYLVTLGDVRYMKRSFKRPVLPISRETFTENKIRLYKGAKIIVAGMTQRLEATFDPGGLALGVGVYAGADPSYSPLYILALLNSNFLSYLFRLRFQAKHLAGGFLAINMEQLGQLPIRAIELTSSAAGRQLAAEIVQGEYANCLSAKSVQPLLTILNQWLTQHPKKTNEAHDLLAFLAQTMLNLKKQEFDEEDRFLRWLESFLRISPDRDGNRHLDSLRGKSTLRNYLGDYQKGEAELPFEKVCDILHDNRARLGISLSDAIITAQLSSEYEASLEKLRKRKAQLTFTDSLIDQIVYRLYGLTEEEIAVIEGRSLQSS